jgi:hypothetical protein
MCTLVQCGTRHMKELGIGRGQPHDQLLASLTTQTPRRAARRVQLRGHAVDDTVELLTEASVRARRCQAHQRATQMGGKGLRRFTLVLTSVGKYRLRKKTVRQTDRTAPFFKGIEYVGLTKRDVQRSPSSAFAMIPIEASIDPVERDFERHPSYSPIRYEIKRGSDDPNEMTIVLLAQIAFYLTAIVCDLHRLVGDSPDGPPASLVGDGFRAVPRAGLKAPYRSPLVMSGFRLRARDIAPARRRTTVALAEVIGRTVWFRSHTIRSP